MKTLLLLLSLCSFIGITLANKPNTPQQISYAASKYKHYSNKHHKKVKHSKRKISTSKSTSKITNPKINKAQSEKMTAEAHTKLVVSNNKATITLSPNIRQPKLYSYSAIALNANTGEIIISKNPNTKLPIASITKLMTAMVLLDSQANLHDYITITSDDVDTLKNTYSRLKVGMQFRRQDLLLLALMSSENRAAHALARTTYKGGLGVFIRKMNEKAIALGMHNSQFYDPTGLTNQNQSTAIDLSKMVQNAYTYEQIRRDTTTKNADVMFGPRYIHRYINSDALVRENRLQIQLSKTGFINEAGHCLALYSIINNKPIVMIFLNSTGKSGRLIDAMIVKNYIQNSNKQQLG